MYFWLIRCHRFVIISLVSYFTSVWKVYFWYFWNVNSSMIPSTNYYVKDAVLHCQRHHHHRHHDHDHCHHNHDDSLHPSLSPSSGSVSVSSSDSVPLSSPSSPPPVPCNHCLSVIMIFSYDHSIVIALHSYFQNNQLSVIHVWVFIWEGGGQTKVIGIVVHLTLSLWGKNYKRDFIFSLNEETMRHDSDDWIEQQDWWQFKKWSDCDEAASRQLYL